MQTTAVTVKDLLRSVIAVPPLARSQDGSLNRAANRAIIRHIEKGGISTLLYGGNANFYHIPLSQYREALSIIAEEAAANTLVVPSAGPAYGTMMDQLPLLKEFKFPTAMVLPMQGVTTDAGVATGFRKFVEGYGKPCVLYIKADGYIEPGTVKKLADDGLISWIKYATVRPDPAKDPYLEKLVAQVNPEIIVSGIGEQPAIVHLQKFHLTGFTTGCGCIAPALSQSMLKALQAGDTGRAEKIRQQFTPLEDLRNEINPIRVLHDAFTAAGIADTGPALPLMSNLEPADFQRVKKAACQLLELKA